MKGPAKKARDHACAALDHAIEVLEDGCSERIVAGILIVTWSDGSLTELRSIRQSEAKRLDS